MKERRKDRLELRVGLLTLVGLLILGCMIIVFNDENIFEKGYTVHVTFNYISGIAVGGPVYLSGVEIGRIDAIQLAKDSRTVELGLWIKNKIKLRNDVEVTIGSRGVMGERFVEIMANPASQGDFLKDGAHLVGREPITLTAIISDGERLLNELRRTFSSINAIVTDEDIAQNIDILLRNLNGALVSVHDLAENINSTIAYNRDEFSQSITLLNANLDLLQNVFESLETAEGTLGRLLKDDTIYKEFEALIKDIRANPWKLLRKTREKKPKESAEQDDVKRSGRRK